tara:strand:- start:157 stop:393 length:237 start_codon:yes stop_codon:yes gene_type:complete
MPHYISQFDKKTEKMIKVYPLLISLKQLQKVFGISVDNPMYDSYEISEDLFIFFERQAAIVFDSAQFDYFVEYDADNV